MKTTIGQTIALHRKKVGLTQEELAKIVGLTLRAYQLYEYGEGYPTFKRLIIIADFFDVSLDYLVGRSDLRERK